MRPTPTSSISLSRCWADWNDTQEVLRPQTIQNAFLEMSRILQPQSRLGVGQTFQEGPLSVLYFLESNVRAAETLVSFPQKLDFILTERCPAPWVQAQDVVVAIGSRPGTLDWLVEKRSQFKLAFWIPETIAEVISLNTYQGVFKDGHLHRINHPQDETKIQAILPFPLMRYRGRNPYLTPHSVFRWAGHHYWDKSSDEIRRLVGEDTFQHLPEGIEITLRDDDRKSAIPQIVDDTKEVKTSMAGIPEGYGSSQDTVPSPAAAEAAGVPTGESSEKSTAKGIKT
jgi:hypothetical protein